jgi:hypothetical protein
MRQAKKWTCEIFLTEQDGVTDAHAVLETQGDIVHGKGSAHCRPGDIDIAEIGDELAAARALADLGRRLIATTCEDIEAVEGRPVHLAH